MYVSLIFKSLIKALMKNKVDKFRVCSRIANSSCLIDYLITHPKGLIIFSFGQAKKVRIREPI
jgi:hypothetical protein